MTIYPSLSLFSHPEARKLYHRVGFETDVVTFFANAGVEFDVYKTKEELSDIIDVINKYGKPEAFKITEKKPKWANHYCIVEVLDFNAIECIIK